MDIYDFVQDGILNIPEAIKELRYLPNTISRRLEGSKFLLLQFRLREILYEKIEQWIIFTEYWTEYWIGNKWFSHNSAITAIKHLHNKSDLSCSIERIKKNEWQCCVCREKVPIGILWFARTQKLREAI